MSQRLLQNDLDAILATIDELPKIHKENTNVTRESDSNKSTRTTKYIRTKLFPVATEAATAGIGGFDEFAGIYEVQIFVPHGDGVDEVNHFADLIINKFRIGTVETDNLCIRIDAHDRGVGQEFTNHYMLPISIDYLTHIQRPQ